ncbi:MAG: spore coat protein SP96 [Actinomycetia bacterium]|nr:spore coat protein SP96 [Actinomycetes bacterium]
MPDPNAPQPQYAPSQPQYVPTPQPYVPPAPQQPQPLTMLSGGMKAAWFFIGFLLGIPGILIAYATNQDKLPNVKSECIKFSAIGFGISIALWVLMGILWSVAILSFIPMLASSSDMSYFLNSY